MNKKWNKNAQKILQFFDVENVVVNEGVILGTINSEFVQGEAETMLGRPLTDIELNRFKYALWLPESFEALLPIIHKAIENCSENTVGYWNGFDADYQKKKEKAD